MNLFFLIQRNSQYEESDLKNMGGIGTVEWMTFLQGSIMASTLDEAVLKEHDGKFYALSVLMKLSDSK